jgi:hypothetical protein
VIASSYWFWDHPSWGAAEVWALLFLLVPSLAFRTEGMSFLSSLVNGADNRWSTSKVSVVLWTYAVVWAFLAVLLHTRGHGLSDVKLSSQYLLLLGIPGAAAVSAKAITQTKVADNEAYKKAKTPPANAPPPNALKGVGQLVSDDSGNSDLLDAQYFIFTLLLLGYFLVQFLSSESATLPVLPDTLVGLTGVSAATYVAKKGVKSTA